MLNLYNFKDVWLVTWNVDYSRNSWNVQNVAILLIDNEGLKVGPECDVMHNHVA